MLLLVLGSNVLVMFVGWEGVGLCSYLLIGYYYTKKSASDAAKKAFIVNRIGDYAFILGTLLLVVTARTLDFKEIATQVAAMPPETTFGTLYADHAAALHRRHRQVGADPALTSGCRTRWRARRRSRPSSMRRRW